jgi:ATP-dependent RNA helicase RhlE
LKDIVKLTGIEPKSLNDAPPMPKGDAAKPAGAGKPKRRRNRRGGGQGGQRQRRAA